MIKEDDGSKMLYMIMPFYKVTGSFMFDII